MTVNTTAGAAAARAMSVLTIDRAFEQVAGALKKAPKARVKVPQAGGGDGVVELGYNGRMFLIKRGEPVELPVPLIEVLERAGMI
ncbi:MAG: hypothetical protein VB067_02275 [Christensenellaceae bacterium]|nr:hypothetical protein [Christensenellaceae bacterium]MEA5065910.1 hypothetical protein [Eubacteriales bacterium]MEA5067791.1 hypothetical protein [Christensenellaceae bacterium]